jgi:hypothetical protein
MANAFIPRDNVHEWSDTIGEDPTEHQATLTRLLKSQRRLTKFIEENRADMEPATAGVTLYLIGVLVRLFDLAGGQLRSATWAQLREASAKVQAAIPRVMPLDDGLPERVRKVEGRAQPHILDEALMSLFERGARSEEEADLSIAESVKVFFLMWVVTEVLDANWRPASSFEGEASYTYVHIEPATAKASEG